jgi:hypothetical protein
MESNEGFGDAFHTHPQSMEAVKLFICQIFESAWITVMNRQILGLELRQRDPISLVSCRRSPRPKLLRHKEPPARAIR